MKCPSDDVVRLTPGAPRVRAFWAGALVWLGAVQGGWCQDTTSDSSAAPVPEASSTVEAGDKPEKEGEKAKDANEFETKAAAETDPLVRAILDARPTTPQRWIGDAQSLLNLNRREFAREYLKQFLATNPDAAELARIQARFGTALFMRMSATAELQPEGAAVAEAVLRAAGDQMQDAARLAALVERLKDPDSAARRATVLELVRAGAPAAVPLISVLGDGGRASEHAAVRAALVALGNAAVEPLIAALESPSGALQVEVLQVLGTLKPLAAVPHITCLALAERSDPTVADTAHSLLADVFGEVPSREAALRFLSRRFESHLLGMVPGPVDQDDQVTLWVWDSAHQLPQRLSLPAADASFLMATRLAEQRHWLEPDNAEYERMYLATGLEAAQRWHGYDRSLAPEMGAVVQRAFAADTHLLEEVLRVALEKRMPGGALAALDLLGQSRDGELLRSDDGQPRLVAAALLSPLPRVQFAAARAIMTIDPTRPYPGSSHLPETLAYLSASGHQRRILIGHPRADEAGRLAGLYQGLGFTVDTRHAGRALALQAFARPDYDFVLIHDALDRPRYRELVQILRRDPRTAELPLGVVAREENAAAAAVLAKMDPRTLALAPPQTENDVSADARRLLAAAGRGQVSLEERSAHASFALDALARLAAEPEKYHFYELLAWDQRLEHVLNAPAFSAAAARVLGLLGTPRAQQALVQCASTQTRPLADRQAAAAAFRDAVSRRGLLLTRDQLLRQYDIYNASQLLDGETQRVLASLLDTMEAPSR